MESAAHSHNDQTAQLKALESQKQGFIRIRSSASGIAAIIALAAIVFEYTRAHHFIEGVELNADNRFINGTGNSTDSNAENRIMRTTRRTGSKSNGRGHPPAIHR